MKARFIIYCLIACTGLLSCTASKPGSGPVDDKKISLVFIQVNDVYEIAPLEGGKTGGMARLASIKRKYKTQNPNSYLIMCGDFLSPSVYNSLKYENKRVRGRQMVECMNSAGVDLAIFGNHEFDISESELQSRINESLFDWLSSNSFHKQGDQLKPFEKNTGDGIARPFPLTYCMQVKDADGTTAKIGFIALTLPFNKAAYVGYKDVFTTAATLYAQLKDTCDAVVAITHQSMEDDILLAQKIPGLAMILGGHEHDMRYKRVGNVTITKAHANARSAYIVKLRVNKNSHDVNVTTHLEMLDESIPLDQGTDSVVNKWTTIADKSYASAGFSAKKIVMQSGEALDGRETEIRSGSTNFTKLIVAAMEKAAASADLVIVNAGSIRVDDIVEMPITQYDILRSLPFGGSIAEADMKGEVLIKTLAAGQLNRGTGGFLHYPEFVKYDPESKIWLLKDKPIETEKLYKVALPDFLLTGGEANMEFLKKDNPGIVKVYPVSADLSDLRSDIRLAIIRYMEKL